MKTGSLANLMIDRSRPASPPVVGMGATICLWTDRTAATVTRVHPGGKRLFVREDHAVRTDKNGMSDCQTYAYSPDPNAPELEFTLRRDGRWVRKGESARAGMALGLGFRMAHHDYSF